MSDIEKRGTSSGHDSHEEGPIRGKVAQILNARDLVINRGRVHGVFVGMQFVILNRNAKDIKDPETKQIIGSVPVAKTIVKVVNLQDEMAIARTFREVKTNTLIAAVMASRPREETLRTQESTAIQELDEKDSYVKTGDDAIEASDSDEYLLPPI